MPSRVRFENHGSPHADLITWLGVYRAATPGVKVGDNTTVQLDLANDPQPDAILTVLPSHGGAVKISDDDYVEGAPDLAAEVATSSAAIDLNQKLNVYRRNGVREYVVWRVLEEAVDWFVLRAGRYDRLVLDALPTGEPIYRSEVFPGLWLAPAALIAGDLAKVLAILQQGLAAAEHVEFAASLSAKGRK